MCTTTTSTEKSLSTRCAAAMRNTASSWETMQHVQVTLSAGSCRGLALCAGGEGAHHSSQETSPGAHRASGAPSGSHPSL